jgi:tetratricopeptide (TPR) repeat protein
MIRQKSPPEAGPQAKDWMQRLRTMGLCFVLAAMTLAVFGQTVGFGFVNFDDDVYIYDNAQVKSGLSLGGFAWVVSHADCNLYHPLTMLSLMGDYQIHGLRSGGYHLINVLLHTASVLLLFLTLRRMTGALWRSAFVAAVFAIHPLRVESVAWVAERKDVLGGFFFMLTLAAYAHYVRKPKSLPRYLLVVAAFVLALLSKPTVVTLPFVLLLLDYWPLQRFDQPGSAGNNRNYFGSAGCFLEKIPLLALAAGTCVLTVLAAEKGIVNASVISRLGNALVSYAIYLRQMVWPEGLAAYYPLPKDGHAAWTIALSFLLLALITTEVFIFRRKRPWLLTGWFWYLGMLTPMIGLVQTGGFAHADRMTYLPQIGLYLLFTWTVAGIFTGWRYRRQALGGLAASVLFVLFFCARTQAAYWRDSETLWTHALTCTTDNHVANNNLGFAVFKKENMNQAIGLFQKALQIKSSYPEARNNLGSALFQIGKVDDAIVYYKQALQIRPDYAEARYNLSVALLQKGKVDDAIAQCQKALQIRPDYADARVNLGLALMQKDSVDEAIAEYQKALQIMPGHADAHDDLGIALFRKGDLEPAIAQFQIALQSAPDNAHAHNNLATAFVREGRLDDAIEHYQKALKIKADDADVHYGLGIALFRKGSVAGAIAQYQSALQIEPSNPKIQNNLALVLATCPEASLRNGKKAVELARQANALAAGENPIILRTLAAAYAEAGQFDQATENAQKALDLAKAMGKQDFAAQMSDELQSYKAGVPLRQ